MSNTEKNEISDKIDSLSKLANLIKILLVSAFAMGGWVGTLEWRQRQHEEQSGELLSKLEHTQKETTAFSLWKERTDANRFDLKMATDLSNNLSNRANLQDLKVQKLEMGQEEIRKSLNRIENKLGTN
jgi:hypothetical protein